MNPLIAAFLPPLGSQGGTQPRNHNDYFTDFCAKRFLFIRLFHIPLTNPFPPQVPGHLVALTPEKGKGNERHKTEEVIGSLHWS